MKRAHRTAHRSIWIILAILIAAGLTSALLNRKPQKKKKADAAPVVLVFAKSAHMPEVLP